MRDHTPIDGPDFLDEYADRLAANGMTLEADQIRGVLKQWLGERVDQQRTADEMTMLQNQITHVRAAVERTSRHTN